MPFTPFGPVLQKAADTGTAGFNLTAGTPTILSWTAPNDGAAHPVMIFGNVHTTVATTGGAMQVNATAPDGSALTPQLDAGTRGVGTAVFTGRLFVVGPGTTVTVTQSSGLTGGAAVAFIQIWGG